MTNAEFVHKWFEEVWNNKREDAVDEMLAEDGVGYGLPGGPIRGPEAFKVYQRQLIEAFPDLRVEVVDTVTEGDKIAARCIVTGVHKGNLMGLTATNNPVDFDGMLILHLRDGKIVEAWNEFNFNAMYKQLGQKTLSLE